MKESMMWIPGYDQFIEEYPGDTLLHRALRALAWHKNWYGGENNESRKWNGNPNFPQPEKIALAALTGDEKTIDDIEQWIAIHCDRIDIDWSAPTLHPQIRGYMRDVFGEDDPYHRTPSDMIPNGTYCYRVLAKGKPERMVTLRSDGKCYTAVYRDEPSEFWCDLSDVQYVRAASGFDF